MVMPLSRSDWIEAGLLGLRQGGPDRVAVEPLAAVLGATKGSFYWHFRDRDSLLTDVLALWERRYTDEVIASLGDDADPRRRLHRLLGFAFGSDEAGRVEISLTPHSEVPGVAEALGRVTAKRVGFLTDCFLELGHTRAAARHRGLLAYSVYIGWYQLRLSAPGAVSVSSRKSVKALLESLLSTA
jgi:AcrR family transcriptional regulator